MLVAEQLTHMCSNPTESRFSYNFLSFVEEKIQNVIVSIIENCTVLSQAEYCFKPFIERDHSRSSFFKSNWSEKIQTTII